jgi:iron complex outermembrane receptor protein
MTDRKTLLAGAAPLALVLSALSPNAAAAADAAGDPQAATSVGTGASDESPEIIVTARHRTESSQAIPLAISVVGGDHIDNTGAFNVGRLTQLTPTLQFYSSNPRNTTVNIRGIGAPVGLTNDGIDQGVGIYVDDVYYSRAASATFDFLDVAQIEVLRGPQGTLYGKNTTAGAINITTRQPTFTPEVRAEASVGNLGFYQVKAAVSGPLSDTIAVRLAGSLTRRDGTIHNVTTGIDNNSQDNNGLRAQVLWKPSDRLRITLAGDYNQQDPSCCATVFVRYGATQKAANRQYPQIYDVAAHVAPGTNAYLTNPANLNPFNRVTDLDTPLQAKNKIGGASLKAALDIGKGTLTSIGAWRFWDWDPSNDRDFTAFPITTKSQNPSKQKQFTYELRYNQHSSALDFQVGTFFYYQHVATNGLQQQGTAATKWLLNPSASATNVYNLDAANGGIINGLTSVNTIRLKNTSWSIYGQASWRPLPGLTIQPGARLNYDKKTGLYSSRIFTGPSALQGGGRELTQADFAVLNIPSASQTQAQKITAAQLGVLAPESFSPSFDKWNLSYDITVSYDLARDVHLYATYSKTFQTGGINLNGVPVDTTTGLPQTAQFATVQPESVHHYEAGVKSQWWDRKLTTNLAVFRTDIGNYQAIVNNGAVSSLRGYVANAASVRTQGVEVDFSARPTERFNLYGNFALTDAKYRSFPNAPCPPELSGGGSGTPIGAPGVPGGNSPASCDISGQRLPGVSKISFSWGAEANQPVTIAGKDGQVYLGIDGSYRSGWSSNATPSAYTWVHGYSLTNLRAGFRTTHGIDVYGWVRNVLNTRYYDLLQVAPSNVGEIVGTPGDPRTFGGTVRLQF